ncbi:uncharacterized protein LAESUDRAFT_677219 [Laetiporus sulphureus 93-53]|uniref:Uncharacterized protein n=1 Tax=Laetiporus sulphureus 93-53 TaxID=1314785 RepID=A0A165EYV8_9APHY|nr:uncharacterized protein LAESUDRAFT_677219 [Laetiporus sulphureus 93-53]KZT08005.1 hypothetical protein LAESUDRAFT_677219 [Laetiporus sulphureus 93-53]
MNPYAPHETPAQIYAEETWLQGALLSNIVYGVELALFVICFGLLARKTTRSNYKSNVPLLVFITVIFMLGSFFMGAGAKFTQLAFIENRNYPGGPAAYEQAMFWIPVDELGNVSFVIGNWLMDLLLVWRCMVIYKGSGVLIWSVMSCAFAIFLASFALGIVFLVQTSSSSPFSEVNFTLAYFAMTLSLNVIVTLFIVARLLVLRRRMAAIFGPDSHYTNLASILVESATLFSAFFILFLVPFALNNALSQVFLQTLGQVQTVSSLLIIMRLALGKGWTEATSTRVMTCVGTEEYDVKEISQASSVDDHAAGSEKLGSEDTAV